MVNREKMETSPLQDHNQNENIHRGSGDLLQDSHNHSSSQRTAAIHNKGMQHDLQSTIRTLDKMRKKSVIQIDSERDKIRHSLSAHSMSHIEAQLNREKVSNSMDIPHNQVKKPGRKKSQVSMSHEDMLNLGSAPSVNNRKFSSGQMTNPGSPSYVNNRKFSSGQMVKSMENMAGSTEKTLPPINQAHHYKKSENSSNSDHIKVKVHTHRRQSKSLSNSPVDSPTSSPLIHRGVGRIAQLKAPVRKYSDSVLRQPQISRLYQRRGSDPQMSMPQSYEVLRRANPHFLSDHNTNQSDSTDSDDNQDDKFVQPYTIMSSMKLYSAKGSKFEAQSGKKGLKAWMGKDKPRKPRNKKLLI